MLAVVPSVRLDSYRQVASDEVSAKCPRLATRALVLSRLRGIGAALRDQLQKASEAARRAVGQGFDAVTQREFQEEVLARLAQITEVLVAQHAEIEGLRKRLQALERG